MRLLKVPAPGVAETLKRTPVQQIRNLGGRNVADAAELAGIEAKSGLLLRNGKPISGEFDFIVGLDGKFRIGKGHEFLAGASGNKRFVEAAGRIRLERGRVTQISNESGHFKPWVDQAEKFPQILNETTG